MSLWPEDLLTCTLDELIGWQVENRAWSRDLRHKVSALVNSRLTKEISLDSYLETRKRTQEEAAECRRRATMLDAQIVRHTAGSH
jgi:hypothetical protein